MPVFAGKPVENATVDAPTTPDTPDPARRVFAGKPVGQPAPESPSLLSSAAGSFGNIGTQIAAEFKGGKKAFDEGTAANIASLKEGKDPGFLARLKPLGGMMQELFSPITGAAKAIVGDPIRANVPGPVGEIAARTGELGASFVGPGAVSKSLAIASKALPSYSASVQKLLDAGVRLTPGQIAHGMAKGMIQHLEDALRSIPGTGDFIADAQLGSLEDFNRVIYNKALSNIGVKLPKDVEMGQKAVTFTEKAIGQKYDKLLPKLTFDASDPALKKDILDLTTKNDRLLPKDQQTQWRALLKDINERVTKSPGGITLDGYTYKQVESELSYLARTYSRSLNPGEKMFADSVNELRGAMRDALERSNPSHAAELRDINSAWAMFARAQGASIRRVSTGGIFSPADLLADIKKSTSQGSFARGDGLLQDLANAGQEVLAPTVPDSGTVRRGLAASLAGGLKIGTAGEFLGRPESAVGLTAGMLPYTKPGMAVVNKAARGVPKAVATANKALGKAGSIAAAVDYEQSGSDK